MKIKEVKTRDEWNNLFLLSKKTNISQDWDYGQFREKTTDIQARRFKIVNQNSILAVFQTFEKKIKFVPFLMIVYLNRGPLILDNSVSFTVILKLISKKFSILKGCFFIINPFKSLRNNIISDLKKSYFFGLKPNIYETSYIDLRQSEELLRSNLHSKWRNQLVKSEKNSITIDFDNTETHVDFILKSYEEMVRNKQFFALNSNELKVLFDIFIKNEKVFFLIAFDKDQNIIGYTIILTFLNSAVYFIGWSNNQGRKLNVSNLLLWNSIVYLKNLNYKEFDLGGYDSKNLPGVASFKKRMGGNEELYTERWIKLF